MANSWSKRETDVRLILYPLLSDEVIFYYSTYTAAGLDAPELMSGPFHDALLSYTCDYGMIFIRCKDGISHNPLEYASYEDLSLGAEKLYGTVLEVLGK